MNFKIGIALFFSFGAFVISLFLLFRSTAETKTVKEPVEENYDPVAETAPAIEIAHFMNRIQVFHNKLYFSGKAGNKVLALFYLDEMEEEMGVIAEAGVFDVDGNISENIKPYGLKRVEWMRGQIEKGFADFENDFEQLTLSCNSCHALSKKEFIKIGKPTAPLFSNQDYEP